MPAQQELNGVLHQQETLADYTTWRVGGPAKTLYKPASIADLAVFLKTIPTSEPILFLGLGSNSLIRDKGFVGTVIVTQNCLNGLELIDAQQIRVEAGVSCAKMARFCARNALAGGEFWAGIPGTMGGALRMNAGCYNAETWQHVVNVETISRDGTIRQRKPEEFKIAYRSLTGLNQDEWFVAAKVKLNPGDKAESLQIIKNLLAQRAATQPTSEYNCGSVFKNPPQHFAAQLIEQCGLKGKRSGGAVVSTKHANFIINDQGLARAQDIEDLITEVMQTVLTLTGIQLVREVHIIGENYA